MPEGVTRLNYDSREIEQVALRLLEAARGCRIWLWEGELGTGKTTLIKAVSSWLGVTGHMASPTFSIVNEYPSPRVGTIYHFDFYRLKNEQEALDIGVEEYLDSGRYCFIEWPDRIRPLLRQPFFLIRIYHESDTGRILEYQFHDRKEENRI